MDASQQAALIELGQCALAGTDLPMLMSQTVRLVARTLDVEYSKILELLPDRSALILRAGVGWTEGTIGQAAEGVGDRSHAGYTLATDLPVIVTDWGAETRFNQPPLLRDHKVICGLCVTIHGQHPFGVLGADSPRQRSFTDDDVHFLLAVANVVAMAIERRQVEEALRASEERFRLLAENAADIIYRYHFVPTAGFDYVSPAVTIMTGYAPAAYYADPQLALRLVHPDDRALLEEVTLSPPASGAPMVVRLIRKDGSLIWTEQQIVPLRDAAGQLVGIEGIVRDVTDRMHTYQMLEQRVEERTREIERRHQVAKSLYDILTIMNSNRPLDEILGYITTQASHLLGTCVGAIYRLNHQEDTLSTQVSRGLYANDAVLNLPVRWGPVGQAVVQRQPVVISDTTVIGSDWSERRHTRQPWAAPMRISDRYRALLAVPLIVKDDVYGALALYYHEPQAFSDEKIRLATAVSDHAALAIENARLIEAARGRAVLDERQRLARDLHDSVTQALYGMTLYAEAAARLLSSGDTRTVGDHLRELQETAQEALQEMRLLIFELRLPVLEQAGLVAALQARLEAVEGRSNLQTTFHADAQIGLSVAVEQELYRIAQEVLNNVLKHAHAQHITVSVRQEWPTVMLEIVDDGIGFDCATVRGKGGLGLRGVAERVAQLGGRLIVHSAPGVGTQVRVEVSL